MALAEKPWLSLLQPTFKKDLLETEFYCHAVEAKKPTKERTGMLFVKALCNYLKECIFHSLTTMEYTMEYFYDQVVYHLIIKIFCHRCILLIQKRSEG